METPESSTNQLVDHLFRNEAGKLVATLTRIFGTIHIDLAEDIVQDTLITALHHWSDGNIPENPAAWITQVAKRKVLNELKRAKSSKNHLANALKHIEGSSHIEEVFLSEEIKDSQLRMIFTCCHPQLPVASQMALTLKTLCGFGISEISKALLTRETTIYKRLYRAKQKIRALEISFEVPSGKDLEKRLNSVCLALYLLFNEGYNSSHRPAVISKDLCLEAIRLTQLLVQYFQDQPKLSALLALMCLHAARFEARTDHHGAIIIFEDQDRSLWNKELISNGMYYLTNASVGKQLTEYHLEAGIAAEHCLSKSFADTDWNSIYHQYEKLYKLKQNPIVLLNLAIIKSQTESTESSLRALEKIADHQPLKDYYLLPMTRGILSLKSGRHAKARDFFKEALKLTRSPQEIAFIKSKLKLCGNPINPEGTS